MHRSRRMQKSPASQHVKKQIKPSIHKKYSRSRPVYTTIQRNMAVYSFKGKRPIVDPSAYISPEASVIGDVRVGKNVSILAGATVRADNDTIILSDNCNIQEGAVLHTDPGLKLYVGPNVSVGHNATLHGCYLESNIVVGMNSLVMNHTKIGSNSIVGAGAMVLERKDLPPNSLIVGSPAKVAGETTEKHHNMISRTAKVYADKIPYFKEMECVSVESCHGDASYHIDDKHTI